MYPPEKLGDFGKYLAFHYLLASVVGAPLVSSVGWVCSVADVSVSADSVESELTVSVD